ncbi:uncharacterized protein LOC130184702 [Seriola aureovittata]|uniref:uncharacterized protein LOC130184702 n=1 Tax=Seriola aureovittata TaxID=2871759 RepID=UPI0024BD5E6C|nr:uncharacterized protein LOC130184702 [Seriola aureovittata]
MILQYAWCGAVCGCSHQRAAEYKFDSSQQEQQQQRPHLWAAGADGRFEDASETTWPSSELTARPCLASAASELHFSPASPEETPRHKMLFLPAAALCCLCSALVAMAAELIQDQLSLTRRVGDTVSFSCGGTDQCDTDYVNWFQKKEKETFSRILNIDTDNCNIGARYNHPQKDDFTAVNNQNSWELEIENVKLSHSASYYCSCWKKDPHSEKYMILVHNVDSFTSADTFNSRQVFVSVSFTVGETYYHLIFGSGTKLYVTDEAVVKPVVSVYPAAPRAHPEGKSSLLCLASAMSPPLVQFSWKRQKEDGPLEELKPDDGEQLELRELGRTAAILLIHQPENSTYKYRCYVKHEGGKVEAQTQQEVPAPAAPCPPEREPADLAALQQDDFAVVPLDPLQPQCRVKLLCLLYTVLIVKSLVYCCGLSLLMILTNKGPSTNCTHAD